MFSLDTGLVSKANRVQAKKMRNYRRGGLEKSEYSNQWYQKRIDNGVQINDAGADRLIFLLWGEEGEETTQATRTNTRKKVGPRLSPGPCA